MNDDAATGAGLGGKHAGPPFGEGRVREEEQVFGVQGRQVHATVAHLRAEVGVPKGAVRGVRAEEVHHVGHVFDAVGQVAGRAAVAVHGGRDVFLADPPLTGGGAVVLVLD